MFQWNKGLFSSISDNCLLRHPKTKSTRLAAKRAGITELILSEENRKDIAEIKPEYVEGLTFHYVRTNDDVLRLALE